MSIITVRLSDKLLEDLDHYANALDLPRAEYIRRAVEFMNKEAGKKERAEQLKKASLRVRAETLNINTEFDRIENDPKD